MLLENVFSKIIKTFPKNPLNSKNYSVTNVTAFCEIFTPARRFTTETFLFEIFFHFSPIKTFPFGLILMGHISVFQMNDPKSMNFFLMSESFALAATYEVFKNRRTPFRKSFDFCRKLLRDLPNQNDSRIFIEK